MHKRSWKQRAKVSPAYTGPGIFVPDPANLPLRTLFFPSSRLDKEMDSNEQRERSERLQRLGLEADDYYYSEEGYLVFTEGYHLKRGYCCQSGCRHCPFGFNDKKGKVG